MVVLQRKELSFQMGEITPRYLGRSDTEVYSKGLAIAENVIIDRLGGAFRREGLEHFARVDGNAARIYTLQVTRIQYYTFLLTDLKLTIIAPGAQFVGSNLFLNGNFNAGSDHWTTLKAPATSLVNFGDGEVVLLPEQNDIDIVKNGDFTLGGLDWLVRANPPGSSVVTFSDNQVTMIPRGVLGDYAGIAQEIPATLIDAVYKIIIEGDFGGNALRIRVGITEGEGSLLDVVVTSNSTITFTATVVPFWLTMDCESPNSFITLDRVQIIEPIDRYAGVRQQSQTIVDPSKTHLLQVTQLGNERLRIQLGSAAGLSDVGFYETTAQFFTVTYVPNVSDVWIDVIADGQNTAEVHVTNIATAAEEDATGIGIEYVAPWTESQLDAIHFVEAAQGDAVYFCHPNVPIHKIIYSFANDVFGPLLNGDTIINGGDNFFTNKPTDWNGTSWPSTGASFQGRLWFGGTPNERQRLWASVSGSPDDFTQLDASLDPPAPTAATSFDITLQALGRIEWMVGTKNMLVGTENSEYIITSDSGVLSSLDFQVEKQSDYGSNNMQGIQVGEKVFYLTPDGRKLRAMAYNWDENNWLSEDLTMLSDHVTIPIGKFRCWAQHPRNIFIVVMEDGTLAVMTYDRSAQTVAWTRVTITGMKVLDIATGRDSGINEIILAGQRDIGKIDIETNSGNKEYLDSYSSVFDAGGTNVITGLDHLEGRSVRPIVDGAVEPEQLVIGGAITTQRTGQQLYAGLGYTSTIKTLPPDVAQSQIRSFMKRWNQVYAFVLDSKMPVINGVRPPDRTPSTPMDTVEPNATTHYSTINLGWDDFGQITIEENLPVAMNILAIYGEMGAENL